MKLSPSQNPFPPHRRPDRPLPSRPHKPLRHRPPHSQPRSRKRRPPTLRLKPEPPEPLQPPVQSEAIAPPPEAQPAPYDPTRDRSTIAGNLTNVQGYLAAQAAQLPLFLESSAEALFLENGNPRSGIEGFAVLNDIKLQGGGGNAVTNAFDPQVHIPLQPEMTADRLDQGYGGGQLYEVKTAEGETVFFANAVPSKSGGSSTVLFLWTYNPNSPPNS